MDLDAATLGAVSILLSLLMGGLLLFAWLQNRTSTALCWWGAGFFISAVGVGVMGLQNLAPHQSHEAIVLGQALVVVGVGCKYSGCRNFNGRPAKPALALAGAAVWLAAWPYINSSINMQSMVIALIAALYLGLAAWELARHAPCKLISQHAAVAVYFTASMVCALRGALGPLLDHGLWANFLTPGWSAEWALLVLLYIPTIAVLLLSMAKERLEYNARQSAMTDALTLLPNRRALFSDAEALADRAKALPLSCLFFDIDSFKAINDTYGHRSGDSVLQSFAKVLCGHFPKGVIGRLGGEEFVAFVQADPVEAEKMADHVRQEFAQAKLDVKGTGQIHVTVSVGCASGIGSSPDELLAKADHALYKAKSLGRNRVVRYDTEAGDRMEADNLVPFRTPVSRHTPPNLLGV